MKADVFIELLPWRLTKKPKPLMQTRMMMYDKEQFSLDCGFDFRTCILNSVL